MPAAPSSRRRATAYGEGEFDRERALRWLAAIVAVGAVLRFGVAFFADRDQLGFNDQFLYHHMAEGLARGDGYQIFGEPTVRWPPLYAFLLSLVYRVTGPDPTWGFMLNAALSLTAVPLTYLVGARTLGRRPAVVAAAVVALLPGQWLFAATILTEPLATVQLLLAVWLVVRWRPSVGTALAFGLLIGTAALTRGEGMLLGLVALVGWWRVVPLRRVAPTLLAAALVAAVIVAPWAARNERVAGEAVGLSANSGETIWAGHNPTADGGATYAPSEVLQPAAETPFGAQRELANARLLREDARRWATSNPHKVVALIPLKLIQLVSGDGKVVEIWIEAEDPVLGTLGPSLAVVADFSWYALFGVFLLGMVRSGRRQLAEPWVRACLALPAVSLVLYGVLLYGNFRYRIPYEPVLVLVATPMLLRVAALRPDQGP
ncbi:ArnT family glycosyltransferase [Actinospongicola halichondriae]|uniref:ArnT family glycosyltransferase n=1 Tax=Actinospongicola halichondriae TaxID=3236844 RepID=UPI003D3F0D90